MTDADRSSPVPSRPFQRRTFLGALAGGAAAAALLLRRELAHGEEDDSPPQDGPSPIFGARAFAPGDIPCYSQGGPALSFLALGDTGWLSASRDRIVEAMERTARTLPFSFVCLLGDNFYPYGVSSTDDPRWDEFERAFSGPHLDLPIRAALGNHDHHGNVEAQVEYSASSARWQMPAQYYAFAESSAGVDAEFFVLDTECLRRQERAADEQLRWFEDRLTRSRARWKVVVGHHPVRSNGVHGGIDRVRRAIEDMLERHGVALYLSGHDHDLELLDTGRGFLQVVSGAGSGTRSMRWGSDTLFASAAPGFVWVGLDGDRLQLVFVDAERGPLFCRRFALQDLVGRSAEPRAV